MINRNYCLLLSAYFVSGIGNWLYTIAVPLLVYKLTGSALAMSAAYALTFLPLLLVTPFGGVVADRFDRRGVLIYGDAAAGVVVLTLATAQLSSAGGTVAIYAMVVLVASIAATYQPSFQGFIPILVDRQHLPKANAYVQAADNIISLLGPLGAGGIVALFGALNALYIDAASFLISALLVALIKTPKSVAERPKDSSTLFESLRAGAVFAWMNPIVRYGCILFFVSNFGLTLYLGNLMFFLVDTLQLTPAQVGTSLALAGLGALLGSLCALYVAKRFAAGRVIIGCTVLAGLATLLLLHARSAVEVGLACAIVSALDSILIVTYVTLRQRVIPNTYLGRVIATTRLVSYAAIPIASLAGGWMLQSSGRFSDLIWLGAAIMTVAGCAGWFTPLNVGTRSGEQLEVARS